MTHHNHKPHKPMPKHETELTVVDSPEPASAVAGAGRAQADAGIDPATELPSPAAAQSAQPSADTVSRAEFDQLKAERDQLLDRLARLQAEFENARKRTERERAEFRDYATGSVVEQFLPVLDHFELALKATGSVEQLRSGVELIVKQMGEVLRQLQVVPVPAVGEPFDPRVHEALGTVDRDDIPDHYVAEEIRRGYRLRDRLLRPAMVRVAHNPSQKNE
ncbi:MAG TPA: nucleotide exchange factor GrpE [Terracidiphilus sp.]|nr:nucleotide exchange factor GrpE [Terracidiphilus sp.]